MHRGASHQACSRHIVCVNWGAVGRDRPSHVPDKPHARGRERTAAAGTAVIAEAIDDFTISEAAADAYGNGKAVGRAPMGHSSRLRLQR